MKEGRGGEGGIGQGKGGAQGSEAQLGKIAVGDWSNPIVRPTAFLGGGEGEKHSRLLRRLWWLLATAVVPTGTRSGHLSLLLLAGSVLLLSSLTL